MIKNKQRKQKREREECRGKKTGVWLRPKMELR